MRPLALLTFLVFSAALPARDCPDLPGILEKYRALRPLADDLTLFRLDWLPTLEEAKRKDGREKRPILLIVVRNGYGDLFSGHC